MLRLVTAVLVGMMAGLFLAGKVKAQVGTRMSTSSTLACDTLESIKDIMGAHATDGVDAGRARYEFYAGQVNQRGEAVCVLAPLHGVLVLENVATFEGIAFADKMYSVTVWHVAYDEKTVFYAVTLKPQEGQES